MDETLCDFCGELQGSGSRCANCDRRVYRYATDEVVDYSPLVTDIDTEVLEEIPSIFDPPPEQPAEPTPRITPRATRPAPSESTFPTPPSRPAPRRRRLGRFGIRGLLVAGFILYRIIQGLFD